MRNVNLQQFVKLRRELAEERIHIETRLRQINEALGEMPLPSLAASGGEAGPSIAQPARRGRKATSNGQSLREHVLAVLQAGPMLKEEVLAAVLKRGYKFSTNNPLNSLGVILYGKNPKFSRVDGKFSLVGGSSAAPSVSQGAATGRGGKRKMSPAARARIAAAQRARWAKQRSETPSSSSTSSNGSSEKPKRKMSAGGRRAIAEGARKRWAAAKAAGKSSL